MVQLAPFVYLALYSVYMVTSAFVPEEYVFAFDGLLTVSPFFTSSFLVLSRLLKLCRWHKAACLLPTTTNVESYIDSYVITFTQEEIALINTIIGVVSVIFLVLANHHFFNGRRSKATVA